MCGDTPSPRRSHAKAGRSFPHVRGYTLMPGRVEDVAGVLPTCAGIHPGLGDPTRRSRRPSRMRGDTPGACGSVSNPVWSFPHVRGCTRDLPREGGRAWVLPACAGMHHGRRGLPAGYACPSRICEDAPFGGIWANDRFDSFPHVRGCTLPATPLYHHGGVLPACAGMHPRRSRGGKRHSRSFPHLRGYTP